LNFEVHSATSC